MKETIKKSLVGWLVFLWTVLLGWLAYAWIVWQVSDGQTLTAEMWNNMTGNYDYSTEEVNTWKKWIDGKPIYRKVIDLWVIWPKNLGTFTEIDTIINKDINIRQPGAWSQFLNYEGTNVWIDLRLNETTKVLDIYTWFLASRNNTWYGIIEYTKTTD